MSLYSLVPLLFKHIDFVTPVVVDGTTRILTTIFDSIFDQSIADLANKNLTVGEFSITDGLGAKAPSSEEIDRGRNKTDTTENAEEESTEQSENSDEVEDERELE